MAKTRPVKKPGRSAPVRRVSTPAASSPTPALGARPYGALPTTDTNYAAEELAADLVQITSTDGLVVAGRRIVHHSGIRKVHHPETVEL